MKTNKIKEEIEKSKGMINGVTSEKIIEFLKNVSSKRLKFKDFRA
jgi:hypothetical protein